MRLLKFCAILCLAFGMGALGCSHGSSASGVAVAVSPKIASVITNTPQSFSATVTGTSTITVTWTVTCATNVTVGTCGSIDSNGRYLAPKTVPTVTSNGTITIAPSVTITATSTADTTKFDTATLTIVTGITIVISPLTATVGTDEEFDLFAATVTNPGCNQVTDVQCLAVTWSVPTSTTNPNPNGTITDAGIDPNNIDHSVYKAPSSAPNPSTVTITATSVKDTSVTATATVTIVTAQDPTVTSVSPNTAAIGSLFQDIYITGTNFISTNNVFVNNGGQATQLSAVEASSSVIRARIPATTLATPGVLQVTVSRQGKGQQGCPPANLTPCQVSLIGVRPALVGPTPDSITQGSSGALSFGINGGFFGTPANIAVNATYQGKSRLVQVSNPRQMSVTIGGGNNTTDFATPGLYPVTVTSTADATKLAATNIAVQPNYAGGLSALSTLATVQLPAGSLPGAVAVNPATGDVVVANTGADNIAIFNLANPPALATQFLCTSTAGAVVTNPPNCATKSGPQGVAIDYVRNIALVVNATSQTIAVVDLNSKSIASVIPLFQTPPSDAAQHPPVAVGINPVSGRALIAMQSRPYGLLMDLTQVPPAIIGPVSISTGLKPRVAVEPHLNWALVTPGGLGSLGIVDLNRQSQNTIANLSRTSNVVTVTVQLSTPTIPQEPLAVQVNDAVEIRGVSDTTFNGFYLVTGVGPGNGQFSYTQTGGPLKDVSSTAATGTVTYAEPVATLGLSISAQGIGINPETQTAVIVDPANGGAVSFLSLVDQTVASVILRGPPNANNQPGAAEVGTVAGAFNPLTNVAVTVNPRISTLSVIDPNTPKRLNDSSPFSTGNTPVDVAIDPGTNTAVVANQGDDSVSIVSLGSSFQPLSITETSPKQFTVNSTLQSVAPPSALNLTVIGKGLTCNGGTSNVTVRLDAVPLTTNCIGSGDRTLTAIVPPSMLASAHRYALDVLGSDGTTVSNVTDFTVTQSVDLSAVCSTAPLPEGLAIDPGLGASGIVTVSLFGCNAVALIDLSTGTGQSVAVGTSPQGVAVFPRLQEAVVANTGSNNVSVVNELQASVRTIGTGTGPIGVAADQDTGEAAVANFLASTASIVTLASSGVTSISTGQNPVAVAFDYLDGDVAIAATGGLGSTGSVGIASASSTAQFVAFPLSVPTSVAYDPAGDDFLAASSTGNSVSVYNPVTQQQVGSALRVGINPTAIAYNYLTGTLVSTNTASQTITVFDFLSGRIRAVLTLPPPPANSTLGLSGALQFPVDVHPLTNLAVIGDTANGRVLFIPLPH